jgi:chaperone LolA
MRSLFLLGAFIFSSFTHADGIADLKLFIAQSRALSANFTQTVVNQNGKNTQTSTGSMLIQRPGKFHWRYKTPYPSEIVGDGQKVWLYDPELKQVTIKNMADTLESSPAALLAGNNDFEKHYHVKNGTEKSHLTWLHATPKIKDSTFQQIRIALQNKIIQRIELVDQLGQMTTILFDQITLNPPIKSAEFTFNPPKGVDIISE